MPLILRRTRCGQVWVKETDVGTEEFFDELPYMLRHEAVWHLVSKAMNAIPLFSELDASVQVRPWLRLHPCGRLPPVKHCLHAASG